MVRSSGAISRLRCIRVEIGLQAEEEAFREPEIAGEAEIGVGADAASAVDQLVDPTRRHVERARKARSG